MTCMTTYIQTIIYCSANEIKILGGGGKGGATAPPDFKGAHRILILPQKYFLLRVLAPPDLQ